MDKENQIIFSQRINCTESLGIGVSIGCELAYVEDGKWWKCHIAY